MDNREEEIRLFVENRPWQDPDRYEAHLIRRTWSPGPYQRCRAVITWEPVEEGCNSDLSFVLTGSEAEALVNSLWDAGIRPAGAKGSIGQLAAVNEHLKDLQKLVFKGK